MGQDNELKLFEDKKIRAKWDDKQEKMVFLCYRCDSSINR